MSKQREDLDSEDEPDIERREKQDDQEHVEVSEKDGKTDESAGSEKSARSGHARLKAPSTP